ncbi:MAG: hypothetical protein NC414_00625 [Bacteroidales bacterium]|nr:hypothetical protein [Bacteroidales bacterium]
MTDFTKGGRPPLIDRCDHCIKVRFNNAEWDELTRMMERVDMTFKATFIKQLIFGKPFKVLTTDKNLSVYCAKLSEFFAQYRMIGVNYDLVVKTLRENFTEKKAMTLLYKLEKATLDFGFHTLVSYAVVLALPEHVRLLDLQRSEYASPV